MDLSQLLSQGSSDTENQGSGVHSDLPFPTITICKRWIPNKATRRQPWHQALFREALRKLKLDRECLSSQTMENKWPSILKT